MLSVEFAANCHESACAISMSAHEFAPFANYNLQTANDSIVDMCNHKYRLFIIDEKLVTIRSMAELSRNSFEDCLI